MLWGMFTLQSIASGIISESIDMRYLAGPIGLLGVSLAVYRQGSVSYDFVSYGSDDAKGTPAQSYMSIMTVNFPQMQVNKNQSGLADGYVLLGWMQNPQAGSTGRLYIVPDFLVNVVALS